MAQKTDIRLAKLRKILTDRLRDEGWENIKHFQTATGVPYSLETVRRAFNECDYKRLEASTMAIIMRHLNYEPSEIREMLLTYTDDTEIAALIGGQQATYSTSEIALVEAYREITRRLETGGSLLADQFNLVGRVAGMDVSGLTAIIRKKSKVDPG